MFSGEVDEFFNVPLPCSSFFKCTSNIFGMLVLFLLDWCSWILNTTPMYIKMTSKKLNNNVGPSSLQLHLKESVLVFFCRHTIGKDFCGIFQSDKEKFCEWKVVVYMQLLDLVLVKLHL